MLKYPDEQCVRALSRQFPNEDENFRGGVQGLDLGCGGGRHAKLMLEMGFKVKAIDIVPQNIDEARKLIEDNDRIEFEVGDFLLMQNTVMYDCVIAWNFLYAYNESKDDCSIKLKKIHDVLKTNGKLIINIRNMEDSSRFQGEKGKNGTIINKVYNAWGYVFFSQSEIVKLMQECGFKIDYMEKYSRCHMLNWKDNTSNEMWEDAELNISEVWYAICATRL